MSKSARIPAKPANDLNDLIRAYGSEEGLVEAFLLHQLHEDDYHVLSPTWMQCCLLRRMLSKLDEVSAAVRGEPAFDGFDGLTVQHARRTRRRPKRSRARV